MSSRSLADLIHEAHVRRAQAPTATQITSITGRGAGDSRAAAGKTGPDLSLLRVLAAADEIDSLVLEAILYVLGVARVVVVEDGRRVVQAWRMGDYDLILMDVRMPALDSARATREIRELEVAELRPRARIVGLSRSATDPEVCAWFNAGMDGHVAMPVSIEKLRTALIETAAGMALDAAA